VLAERFREIGGRAEAFACFVGRALPLEREGPEPLQQAHVLADVGGLSEATFEHGLGEGHVPERRGDPLDRVELGPREGRVGQQDLDVPAGAVRLSVGGGDLGELRAEAPRLFGAHDLEAPVEHVAQLGPLRRLSVEGHERGEGLAVLHVVPEGGAVGQNGGLRVVELVALDRADAVEELPPALSILRALFERRAVERDALLGVSLLLQELVHARHEIFGRRVVRERSFVHREGVRDVPREGQRVAGSAREGQHARVGDLEISECAREERGPPLCVEPGREPLDALEPRRHVAPLVGRLEEASARRLERAIGRHLFGHPRRLEQEPEPRLGALRVLHPDLEDPQDTRGVALVAVHGLEHLGGPRAVRLAREELLQRPARLGLLGIELEHTRERVERLGLVRQLREVHVPEPREDRRALRLGGDVGVGGEHLREAGVVAEGLEERNPCKMHVSRRSVAVGDALPRGGRASRVVRAGREDLGGSEGELPRFGAGRGLLLSLEQDARELHVVAGPLVQELELRERLRAGLGVDEARVGDDRSGVVASGERDLGELFVGGRAEIGIGIELAELVEDLDEGLRVSLGPEDVDELPRRPHDRGVVGLGHGEHAHEGGARAAHVSADP
jgi:hypothetical protein